MLSFSLCIPMRAESLGDIRYDAGRKSWRLPLRCGRRHSLFCHSFEDCERGINSITDLVIGFSRLAVQRVVHRTETLK